MKYPLVIAALLGAFVALPAHASDGYDVAQCVVDNDAHDAKMLLATLPGSESERRAGAKLMDLYGGCNDNRRMGGQFAWRERAEIANAALMNWLERGRFDAASPPPRASWALTVSEGSWGYDRNLVSIRQFGDCVVALNPVGALDLARSTRGSVGERAAIRALTPALNDCLAPGKNFTVKRDDLRLIVAEPLYHMVSK
ncbi:MAG: hypothetical protein E7773_12115 [Sphingomonas sp.]|uniref:hypothetical protein n=1 Tax=Sphingomonas sp. TaxID=28214 RepID=UPI0011FF93AF|nr:hypothetical protein [Sphingomonas sp.]THD35191.1 MAG: hypothetical protein E7773_12115 [Sphingomonas sp.]